MKIVRNKVEERYRERLDDLYTPEGKALRSEKNIAALEKLLG